MIKIYSNKFADIQLTPLDIGFDIRLYNYSIKLPEKFKSVSLDIDGATCYISGTPQEIIQEIELAGYKIEK